MYQSHLIYEGTVKKTTIRLRDNASCHASSRNLVPIFLKHFCATLHNDLQNPSQQQLQQNLLMLLKVRAADSPTIAANISA